MAWKCQLCGGTVGQLGTHDCPAYALANPPTDPAFTPELNNKIDPGNFPLPADPDTIPDTDDGSETEPADPDTPPTLLPPFATSISGVSTPSTATSPGMAN